MPHGGTVDKTHLSLERGATYLDGDENRRTLSHPATSVFDSAVADKGCLSPLALGLQLESNRIARFRLDELDSVGVQCAGACSCVELRPQATDSQVGQRRPLSPSDLPHSSNSIRRRPASPLKRLSSHTSPSSY